MKYLKYFIMLLIIVLPIIFIVSLNNAKCSPSSFFQVKKEINLEYAIQSCKFLYKKYVYEYSKNFFLDSPFELTLRKNREKKYGIKYPILKKKYFDEKFNNNASTISENIIGLKNDNLEDFLVDLSRENINESKTWLRSNGGYRNLKFNNSKSNIDLNNIENLKLNWKYQTFDYKKNPNKWILNSEVNPVFVDNKIIFISADFEIVALNAKNGNLIWKKKFLLAPTRRGMTISSEKNQHYLLLTIGNSLVKMNISDGNLVLNFGNNGFVNGVKTITPPIIHNKLVYLVTFGAVKYFDLLTGEKKGSISFNPKEKDFNHGAVPWGGNAFDVKNNILFIVTGNPRPALVGIERAGDNKNANSLIAIDLKQNKILWSFQDVKHDLWDYDISSPPILTELKFDNKFLEVVVVTTKTGNTLVFDRITGSSYYDINYRKTPVSNIPGEIVSSYQIDDGLGKLSATEFKLKDINRLNNKKQKYIKEILEDSTYGWFEPPSFGKKLIIFGLHGGASWPGSTLNPDENILYTPINNYPFYILVEGKTLSDLKPKHIFFDTYKNKCSGCHGVKRNGTFDPNTKKKSEIIEKIQIKNNKLKSGYMPSLIGYSLFSKNDFNKKFNSKKFLKYHSELSKEQINGFKELFMEWDKLLLKNNQIQLRSHWAKFLDQYDNPASNPPWGKLIALDLLSGKIIWEKKLGKIDKNEDINNMTGTITYGGVALTGGNVIFSTGTPDNFIYALNSINGEVIWSFEMESAGSAPPILYEINGKQYVSVVSTGGYGEFFGEYKSKGSSIYTFSIE
jgi:quinoprotein glucose dehydrogenase